MTIQDQKTILKDLLAIEKKLVQLFGKTYLQALEIEAVRKAIKEGNVEFSFDNDKGAKKLFMQKLKALSEEVDSLVLNGVEKSYNDGVDSSIGSIVSGVPSGDQEQVSALCKIAINAQRKLGRDARSYANEKRGGFSISDRVWNIVGNATHEMDILVQNGIMEGKSAAEISRDVRKFLKNPKALFHMVRVKDKDGNWNGTYKLSKAAAAYHPGQGVYRSAYQNALRLARTEVNQGYRVGEWQTYQGNPLVKGFRIKLSDNHTTHDKHTGRYLPLVDICDELQGEYPKEFRWSGWHPNCRCIMVPIIMTPKEFAEYNKAKKEGEERKYVRSKEVKSLPSNFEEWLKNAKPYIDSTPLQRQPYFLQDNQWVVDNKQSVLDAIRKRHKARTPEQIAEIKKRWRERDVPHPALKKKYKNNAQVDEAFKIINAELKEKWFESGDLKLAATTKKGVNGYTYMDGRIYILNTKYEKKLDQVKSALEKIANRTSKDITSDEAHAMATFWHEITHNRHKGRGFSGGDYTTKCMELANEWIARNSLDEFYSKLGCQKTPFECLKQSRTSTGYNRMVTNYDFVITSLNLNKGKALKTVRKYLFEENYATQYEGLKQGLVDAGLKKKIGKNVTPTTSQDLDDLIKVIVWTKDQNEYNPATRRFISHPGLSKDKIIENYLANHGFVGIAKKK